MTVSLGTSSAAQAAQPPQAEITNGILHVSLYLPDRHTGFYRGTRFDWSGVIGSLTYAGHDYYGHWFNKTDPKIIDFVFSGDDIVAGPCSAITGPVEEFSTGGKALGFDQAKPGGTFIKIGIGVLRRPDKKKYSNYHLYEVVDAGQWQTRPKSDSIEFIQEITDPASGYGYRYTKTIKLVPGKPEMILDHKLENTGKRKIESSVYNHNFLVLDKQTIGPDYSVKVPFEIKIRHPENPQLTEIRGHEFTYRRNLSGKETVSADISGFGNTAADYRITIENKEIRAGMLITGDRPLSRVNLWSIRSVLAVEPFVAMSIDPGDAFTWSYTYTYKKLP